MAIDPAFLKLVYEDFDPYVVDSGTEHVAYLLYSIARMTRPRVVVEHGSGHSTLFVLRALADNLSDILEEKDSLREKTRVLGQISMPDFGKMDLVLATKLSTWLRSGNKACNVNPEFYLKPYEPHLYSFEELPANHEYVLKMQRTVKAVGHEGIFSYLAGQSFSIDALPADNLVIDWAWNDDKDYRNFFSEFWPHLNPEGGLLIFHNVLAYRSHFDDIQWMMEQRSAAGKNDLELLFLEEPHKLNQNSCVILRKTTNYGPSFPISKPQRIYNSLLEFLKLS